MRAVLHSTWQPVASSYEAYRLPMGPAEWLKLEGRHAQLTLAPKGSSGRFFLQVSSPKLTRTEHRVARLPGAWRSKAVPSTLPSTTSSTTSSTARKAAGWLRTPLLQGYLGPSLALEPGQVRARGSGRPPSIEDAKVYRHMVDRDIYILA